MNQNENRFSSSMDDRKLRSLESSLGQFRPLNSNVSTAEVMFQAGVEHAKRESDSRRRASEKKMRVWQFATAASLLLASTVSIALFTQSPNDETASLAKERQPESETIVELDGIGSSGHFRANDQLVSSQVSSQTNKPIFGLFNFQPVENSALSERQQILKREVAGLSDPILLSHKQLVAPLPKPTPLATMRSLLNEFQDGSL